MIQQQIIRNAVGRVNYIFAWGKQYENKQKEIIFRGKNQAISKEKNDFLWKQLDKENKNKLGSRSARELIVPIPLSLKEKANQIDFCMSYIKKIQNAVGIEDKNFLYRFSIHNVIGKNGKPNHHMHFLFSEREILDKPEIKNIKTRYYDRNGRMTTKDKASQVIKAHKEIRYFDKKPINDTGKGCFDCRHFCKFCNDTWKSLVLEKNIMNQEQINKIFNNQFKTRHLGCSSKIDSMKKNEYRSKINKSWYGRKNYNDKVKYINTFSKKTKLPNMNSKYHNLAFLKVLEDFCRNFSRKLQMTGKAPVIDNSAWKEAKQKELEIKQKQEQEELERQSHSIDDDDGPEL